LQSGVHTGQTNTQNTPYKNPLEIKRGHTDRCGFLVIGKYRVIQSTTTVLNEVVELMWNREYKCVFTDSTPFPSYDF
jgi:hypothetical protein